MPDDKDSFLTQPYKGGYIHTCNNRTTRRAEVRVQLPDGTCRTVKSIRSAKSLITRNPSNRFHPPCNSLRP